MMPAGTPNGFTKSKRSRPLHRDSLLPTVPSPGRLHLLTNQALSRHLGGLLDAEHLEEGWQPPFPLARIAPSGYFTF